MENGSIGAAIGHRDANQDVLRARLGVFGRYIEIALVGEGIRIEQLELGVQATTSPVFLEERFVGISALRVFVECSEIRRRRRAIEIVVALLDVFTVVPFRSGQSEQPLLQDRIDAIPEGERKAESTFTVTDAQQSVLAPAIGSTPCVIMREEAPAVAIG